MKKQPSASRRTSATHRPREPCLEPCADRWAPTGCLPLNIRPNLSHQTFPCPQPSNCAVLSSGHRVAVCLQGAQGRHQFTSTLSEPLHTEPFYLTQKDCMSWERACRAEKPTSVSRNHDLRGTRSVLRSLALIHFGICNRNIRPPADQHLYKILESRKHETTSSHAVRGKT